MLYKDTDTVFIRLTFKDVNLQNKYMFCIFRSLRLKMYV